MRKDVLVGITNKWRHFEMEGCGPTFDAYGRGGPSVGAGSADVQAARIILGANYHDRDYTVFAGRSANTGSVCPK